MSQNQQQIIRLTIQRFKRDNNDKLISVYEQIKNPTSLRRVMFRLCREAEREDHEGASIRDRLGQDVWMVEPAADHNADIQTWTFKPEVLRKIDSVNNQDNK